MTEKELQGLTDRELLIVIRTEQSMLRDDVASLKDRVTVLEDRDNQQLGMVKLVTFFATILKSLPIVALGAIIGRESV